jgi:hypothetical protein
VDHFHEIIMIAHNVQSAIDSFHPGEVLNYYVDAPGVPRAIRSILVLNITDTELHFLYTHHGKSVRSMVTIEDDLTDYKNVFYN